MDNVGSILNEPGFGTGIKNFSQTGSVGSFITNLFPIAIFIVGFLAFYWLVWGAFQYITAGGNKEGLAKARARITWAIVGLILTLLAFLVAQFAAQVLPSSTGTPLTLVKTVYADVKIENDFGYGYIKSLGQGTSLLVPATFSIATALVIIYFLVGAFKFLTSAGDKEAVAGAKEMITHSIIGFIILMFAFLVFQFILSNLFGITGLKIIQGL